MLDRYTIIYLNDILIYSKTLEEHKKHVKNVFEKLDERYLKLKPLKCEFHKKELEYLGFIVGRYGIKITPDKIKNVLEWPTLKNVKEIMGFLGTAGFNKNFIKEYSDKTEPLTDMTRKDRKFD